MTTATHKRSRPTPPPDAREIDRLSDKLPPHSIEAEMSLLGSMILAGVNSVHLIGEVMAVVNAADFYRPKHGIIFDAVAGVYDKAQSIDTVQLTTRLRDAGVLDQIGGVDYLVELCESVPTAANAIHYAKIVANDARLRRLIDAAGTILRDAHEGAGDVDGVVDRAERAIFEVAQSAKGPAATVSMAAVVQQSYDAMIERMEAGRSLIGLSTGLHAVDDITGGLQKRRMYVFAGRPGQGKSALGINIAEYLAVSNHIPVGIFSLEMDRHEIAERMYCGRAEVDSGRIRRNVIGDAELSRIQEAADEIGAAPIYVNDTPGMTIMQIRAEARRLVAQKRVRLLVIDYLQLVRCPGAESRQNEVAEVSRTVKEIAKELDVPVICLAQLNREVERRQGRRPQLSDLRESGQIEQDADCIAFIHRPGYYRLLDDRQAAEDNPSHQPDHEAVDDTAELIFAKQRGGRNGVVTLHWRGELTRFNNRGREDSQGRIF